MMTEEERAAYIRRQESGMRALSQVEMADLQRRYFSERNPYNRYNPDAHGGHQGYARMQNFYRTEDPLPETIAPKISRLDKILTWLNLRS